MLWSKATISAFFRRFTIGIFCTRKNPPASLIANPSSYIFSLISPMNEVSNSHDDDGIPMEIDFSEGMRGKFYKPKINLKLPPRAERSRRILGLGRGKLQTPESFNSLHAETIQAIFEDCDS